MNEVGVGAMWLVPALALIAIEASQAKRRGWSFVRFAACSALCGLLGTIVIAATVVLAIIQFPGGRGDVPAPSGESVVMCAILGPLALAASIALALRICERRALAWRGVLLGICGGLLGGIAWPIAITLTTGLLNMPKLLVCVPPLVYGTSATFAYAIAPKKMKTV
jgi:hypothetical protein